MSWRDFAKNQNANLGITAPPMRQHDHNDHLGSPVAVVGSIKPFEGHASRQRHMPGEMNGLEKRYAAHLETRRVVGEILSYKFESIKLKLAKATFLTVDFAVVAQSGAIEMHEVKGHWEDDARVKIKVAAKLFPEFTFIGVMWERRAKFWKFEEFPK